MPCYDFTVSSLEHNQKIKLCNLYLSCETMHWIPSWKFRGSNQTKPTQTKAKILATQKALIQQGTGMCECLKTSIQRRADDSSPHWESGFHARNARRAHHWQGTGKTPGWNHGEPGAFSSTPRIQPRGGPPVGKAHSHVGFSILKRI